MTASVIPLGGLIAVLAVLNTIISVLRLAQANPLQQLPGLFGLVAVLGMVVVVVSVAQIFHNAQSKRNSTSAPTVGFDMHTIDPSFSGRFAAPSVPLLAR